MSTQVELSRYRPESQSEPQPLFIYSAEYNMDIGPHVFPVIKYGYVYLGTVDDPRFSRHRFREPQPISRDQAALVHTADYLNDLWSLTPSPALSRSELPLTREIVEAFALACGGTLEAARQALKMGSAINIGGGFHHCYHDHAEGFCYLNDVAIAIRVLQKEELIQKALIIDLDLHQGNGTAAIFQNDKSVFTFSMHEASNYPSPKEKSRLDIPLATGCADEEYLTLLSRGLAEIKEKFQPDIIFYLAGVDPYENDLLGGLAISKNGMAERDRMVREFLPAVPLTTVLAGGYAVNTMDTVKLHIQTCEILAGLL